MLHEVIPIMDILNRKMEAMTNDTTLPNIIRRAVQRGIMVLDKYYALTDESIIGKTAMCMYLCFFDFTFVLIHIIVLHPKYRKRWFACAEWEDEWIDTAVGAARKVWRKHYKPLVKQTLAAPMDVDDNFAELDAPVNQGNHDPFEDFIAGAMSDEDPITHWTHLAAKPGSPITTLIQALAQMALDFLSAPATSTDVERLFSHSGLVVAKRRHNLTADNIRQSTTLGNWLSVGIVPTGAIAKVLNTTYGKKVDDASGSEWSDSEDEAGTGGGGGGGGGDDGSGAMKV